MDTIPQAWEWLREGLPLTLVLDLLDPTGPNSPRIYASEVADTAWIPAA